MARHTATTFQGQPMIRTIKLAGIPGVLATGLAILFTSLWTFWGVAELFYEGWGLPFPSILRYLAFAAVCYVFTIAAVLWPRLGGWALVLGGSLLTAFMASVAAGRGYLTWQWVLGSFPITAMIVLTGLLFLLDGRYRRHKAETSKPGQRALWRHLRPLLAAGIPLAVALATAAFYVPLIVNRVDDGDRSARLIAGNGVTLIWAPEGPGWNWKQPWGGYPSWNSLALYGREPTGLEDKLAVEEANTGQADMDTTGLCRYLSEDGLRMMPEPVGAWRMPTTDELVRSLVWRGEQAGCSWDAQSLKITCVHQPNKDAPLWAADEEPIYYWSGEERDNESAFYVGYSGVKVHSQPKSWGNPRHGYRCVREP